MRCSPHPVRLARPLRPRDCNELRYVQLEACVLNRTVLVHESF
jgi:hypothetical protein